jgi:hypothetical protein
VATISRELMVWFYCLLYWLWLPMLDNWRFDSTAFSIHCGYHSQRTDGLIIVSSLLVLAANAWLLTVWFRWIFYSLWLPLLENRWFDYSVFSIGFGCQCLTTDGLIPQPFLFTVATIARELMVWL